MRMMFRVASGLAAMSILALSLACLPGCSSTATSNSTTVGEELQDLEDARNKGLLTESEYQKQ